MSAHPVFAGMPVTVFETMSGLARQHGAINLGQGFPDAPGPEALRRLAAEAVLNGSNQYPPSRGDPILREAVVEHYRRLQGVDLALDGVVITSGATEALAATLLANVRPGDEVIILEPAYDAYRPLIVRAGGVVRAVTLQPPAWRLTEAALEAAVGPRTRMVLVNNPLNPAARVFDAEEIAALARVCVRRDLVVVSDEVWEHVVFDGRLHRPLLAAPGMADRVVKIGSAGKMFGLTGWKVGFACGSPDLIAPLAKAHQFLTFSTPPNLQTAVAAGLTWPRSWFEDMRAGLGRSRDRLSAALTAEGYVVTPSEGTYFLCLDLAASGLALDDTAFCRRIVEEFGVAAIPLSAFENEPVTRTVARLCFAKGDAVLDEAAERLGRARRALL
ncbi:MULTISPECIES: aminotransferase [unclassified Brevundimonas]|uniref:aminotransferase n=1 Tax=unclassified Brevundimonas TaxID=2622653 RepID=UPI002002C4A5|nr:MULTISPECIES: aminotransferase [unclassified Brevundimonas]MCK6104213.1 aminotransferase [Brevundimonas sp. EYE_349]